MLKVGEVKQPCKEWDETFFRTQVGDFPQNNFIYATNKAFKHVIKFEDLANFHLIAKFYKARENQKDKL